MRSWTTCGHEPHRAGCELDAGGRCPPLLVRHAGNDRGPDLGNRAGLAGSARPGRNCIREVRPFGPDERRRGAAMPGMGPRRLSSWRRGKHAGGQAERNRPPFCRQHSEGGIHRRRQPHYGNPGRYEPRRTRVQPSPRRRYRRTHTRQRGSASDGGGRAAIRHRAFRDGSSAASAGIEYRFIVFPALSDPRSCPPERGGRGSVIMAPGTIVRFRCRRRHGIAHRPMTPAPTWSIFPPRRAGEDSTDGEQNPG